MERSQFVVIWTFNAGHRVGFVLVFGMLVKLHPSSDQLRWWIKSALNGFDDLEAADAIENARSDLKSVLWYLEALDHADDAVSVFDVTGIEPRIDTERLLRKA